jgi:hypothetical protein
MVTGRGKGHPSPRGGGRRRTKPDSGRCTWSTSSTGRHMTSPPPRYGGAGWRASLATSSLYAASPPVCTSLSRLLQPPVRDGRTSELLDAARLPPKVGGTSRPRAPSTRGDTRSSPPPPSTSSTHACHRARTSGSSTHSTRGLAPPPAALARTDTTSGERATPPHCSGWAASAA